MNNTKAVRKIVWDVHLYELLRRKEKFSEYINWTYTEHFKNLISEIIELEHEIATGGKWVQWETMDVVYMVGQILNKMHKDWFLDGMSFKTHKDKIMGRSPNLKKCEKVSRETENSVWKLLKSKQS